MAAVGILRPDANLGATWFVSSLGISIIWASGKYVLNRTESGTYQRVAFLSDEPSETPMKLASELNEVMNSGGDFFGFSTGSISIISALLLLSVFSGFLSRRFLFPRLMDLLSRTERIDGRDLFAPRSLGWMIGLLVFWQSLDWIFEETAPAWSAELMEIVMEFSKAGFVILMLVAAYRLVDFLDAFIVVEGENMAARRSLASVAESIGRLIVMVVGVFVVAGFMGFNLNGLIAGLGITGLALALAARDSVANVFGAISIIIDQPFNVGDWIIVDGVEGEVVNIGLRTTMIRSSADTMITMPNSNITNSAVENFSMRRFRRIRPNFEFEEESDPDSLKSFCETLFSQIVEDPRATKSDDSWIKITDSTPPKITISGNFYCLQSSKTQREFTEDILLMARARAIDCNLKFHEPRRRSQM